MSASAVKAKTGKTWDAWFATLDRARAQALTHQAIAQLLRHEHGVTGGGRTAWKTALDKLARL